MTNWTTWPNFDNNGEPDGATIIGTEAGEALFCTVGATAADVAVIAAAPELLEALEGLLGDMGDLRDDMTCAFCGRDYSGDEDKDPCGECESDDCPANIARAAIAKAKGVAHA